MSSRRGVYGQHPYGGVHKAERKRWVPLVRAGKVACWRCGKPIPPLAKWDLGHVDEDGRRRGFPSRHPACISCNRATLPRMLAKARGVSAAAAATPAHDCREEFAPKRCAKCRRRDPTPANGVDRWSTHWGPGGEYNPRCPDCRARGSSCDVALKSAAEDAAEDSGTGEAA